MTRPLALHQLGALELAPLDFVDLAADVGCQAVCIFGFWPPGQVTQLPTVPRELGRDFRARLADRGLGLSGVDFFPVTEGLDLEAYKGGVAFAAELGARQLITAIQDADRPRAVANLGALAELAGSHGLRIGLEFMSLSAGCRTIGDGAWFVDQVGRDNVGLDLDVLHLVRSGGTAAEVAALDPRYFNNAQICDGRGLAVTDDYLKEAGADRLRPGTGDFPLREVFAAVPAETPIDVEVPSLTCEGLSRRDFLADAVARARAILEDLSPERSERSSG
jgi:sugar phosphate isomerase/epimerase